MALMRITRAGSLAPLENIEPLNLSSPPKDLCLAVGLKDGALYVGARACCRPLLYWTVPAKGISSEDIRHMVHDAGLLDIAHDIALDVQHRDNVSARMHKTEFLMTVRSYIHKDMSPAHAFEH